MDFSFSFSCITLHHQLCTGAWLETAHALCAAVFSMLYLCVCTYLA